MSGFKTWGERVEHSIQQVATEKSNGFELRHTPMATRLRKLLNAMPEAERMEPRSLQFFINALAPKYSGKRAASREVAQGLTELGFKKKRIWVSGSHAYCAYWFPEEVAKHELHKPWVSQKPSLKKSVRV